MRKIGKWEEQDHRLGNQKMTEASLVLKNEGKRQKEKKKERGLAQLAIYFFKFKVMEGRIRPSNINCKCCENQN